METPCITRSLIEPSKLFLTSHSLHYSLYMNIQQNCINSRAVSKGLLVHNRIVTNGFVSNVHLNTKLITFYAKAGRTLDARKVFDRMCERNVVSWTCMISGYSQNGCYNDALDVFLGMKRAGFRANQFGYGSALRACTGLRSLKTGIQIHGCVQKSRFSENLFVQSALIDFHSKCGKMRDACSLFERMLNRDLVSWNVILGGFAVRGYCDDSFLVFGSMMREGKRPDGFTFGSVLSVLSGRTSLSKVSQLHGLIVRLGFDSYNTLSGSLINAYAKCGSLESSNQAYRFMPEKDIISCTALILGYAKNGTRCSDALGPVREMIRTNAVIDEVALCAMLSICANTASLCLGRQIHALSFKRRPRFDVAMGNALVDMYAKEAERAFHEMRERNTVSWTTLITGYGKNGFGHKAIEMFKKMECEGLKPNDVTFLSLLFACSHNGLTDEGRECFDNMVSKYKIVPREEHVSCLIDIFARGGCLKEAHQLINEMKIKPSVSLWGSILGACSVHGDTSLGEEAAKNLFRIDPDNPVNYVVLASIYSAAGEWENAEKIMSLIERKSLRKEPGCSILQSTEPS